MLPTAVLRLDRSLLTLFTVLATTPLWGDEPSKAGDLIVKRATLTDAVGRSIIVEHGRLWVPENRNDPKSKLITLAYARVPSTAGKPGPPLVYLAGGPGGAATPAARSAESLSCFTPLLELGDVILLDQRGTGMSRPDLRWKVEHAIPTDVLLSREKMIERLTPICTKAAGDFRAKGIDLAGYTTVQSADDLNDLRMALKAEKLNLLGFSYGTHLGLAAIRRHGQHLANVVLVGTEGPNHTYKLPSTYDRQLATISRLAAADLRGRSPVPDVVDLTRRVMERLDREPMSVTVSDPVTGKDVSVPVGRFGLQYILVRDIGDGNDIPVLPRLLYSIDRGDSGILRWFVEKRFSEMGELSAMFFVMDGSSGVTTDRWARIEREAAISLFGKAMHHSLPEINSAWGTPDLGDEFRSPIKTNVRTLFVSGTLDSNTPPEQADEVRKTFSNSTHVIVENAGHEDMTPSPAVREAIVRFLRGEDVSDVKIALSRPKFVPVEGNDPQISHPAVRAAPE